MTPQEQNKRKAKLLLKQAHEELELVEKIIELHFPRAAISRAYYAAFYAASAVMVLDGVEYSKHSAVISALGRDYIGRRGITRELHKKYVALFRERGKSDYEVSEDQPDLKPELYKKHAEEWVALADEVFRNTI